MEVNLNPSPRRQPRERNGSGYLLTLGVQVPPTANPQFHNVRGLTRERGVPLYLYSYYTYYTRFTHSPWGIGRTTLTQCIHPLNRLFVVTL